jgi:DNA-binding Lrp family transcriptional regulator
MPGRRKEIAPELVAKGRRLYEHTLTPTREIATMLGISRNTLDNRIAEWKWQRRNYLRSETAAADVPARIAAEPADALAAPPVETGAALPAAELPADVAARLGRVIVAEFDVIDNILKVLTPADSAEAERATRTLAVISRIVQAIKATTLSAGQTPPDETDDDPVPRDMDAFRNELAQRLHALIDARQPGQSGSGGRVSGEDAEQGS